MSVLLDFDSFISAVPSLVDWGGVLSSGLAGADQRINRAGSRHEIAYAVDFDTDEEARRFAQRLRRGMTEGALTRFPQIGLKIGNPGTPLVDGAVASGTAVNLKGLAPYHALREGQFLSFIVAGRRYLHSVDAEAVANATGNVAITITPMLRVALAGNEVVEIAVPMIEGLLQGDAIAWEHATRSHEPFLFRIREAA